MSHVVYVPRDNTQIETDVGQLEETLARLLHGGCTELDMLIWMSRFSLESIGQAGIGIPFDTLAETSPPSEYILASKQLTWVLFCLSLLLPWLLELPRSQMVQFAFASSSGIFAVLAVYR
jgi:hypothetical protein